MRVPEVYSWPAHSSPAEDAFQFGPDSQRRHEANASFHLIQPAQARSVPGPLFWAPEADFLEQVDAGQFVDRLEPHLFPAERFQNRYDRSDYQDGRFETSDERRDAL